MQPQAVTMLQTAVLWLLHFQVARCQQIPKVVRHTHVFRMRSRIPTVCVPNLNHPVTQMEMQLMDPALV